MLITINLVIKHISDDITAAIIIMIIIMTCTNIFDIYYYNFSIFSNFQINR